MCKKISKYLFLGCLGGSIYYGLEILFRGFSHWSMFVLGGICFLFFYIQGRVLSFQEPLWRQILRCMIFVTAMEFLTGLIVNKWLCWKSGITVTCLFNCLDKSACLLLLSFQVCVRSESY